MTVRCIRGAQCHHGTSEGNEGVAPSVIPSEEAQNDTEILSQKVLDQLTLCLGRELMASLPKRCPG